MMDIDSGELGSLSSKNQSVKYLLRIRDVLIPWVQPLRDRKSSNNIE